jgi:hypothetical protein
MRPIRGATGVAAPVDALDDTNCNYPSPADLSRRLSSLTPEHLDELTHALREMAQRKRRRLLVEDARAAIAAAAPPAWWLSGDLGLIKRASFELVVHHGWQPRQIVDALYAAGMEVESDVAMTAYSVAAGVERALPFRPDLDEDEVYELADALRARGVADHHRTTGGEDVAA